MRHGSLFSGIGGFDLGFERAGIKTVWQVEIDDYCRRVLRKHFPDAVQFDDIREVGINTLFHVPEWVDIISGGFPCQDISNAGKRAGIDGERSGLWREMYRVICELRPNYVVVENVAALLGRGMERVLGDLAACGYDAEWQSIRASDVGAPHRRERIWIIAHPSGEQLENGGTSERRATTQKLLADTPGIGWKWNGNTRYRGNGSSHESTIFPNSTGWGDQSSGTQSYEWRFQDEVMRSLRHSDNWEVEPDVDRVAHGIPARVDRLRGLGNAIVPQIAEWIGRRIVEKEAQ